MRYPGGMMTYLSTGASLPIKDKHLTDQQKYSMFDLKLQNDLLEETIDYVAEARAGLTDNIPVLIYVNPEQYEKIQKYKIDMTKPAQSWLNKYLDQYEEDDDEEPTRGYSLRSEK